MEVFGLASAAGRRTIVGASLAALLTVAVSVHAQQPPAQAPAAPAPQAPAAQPPAAEQPAPAPDPFKFSTPAALIVWMVKPEGTTDFEAVWSTIRAKLTTATKPEVKAIGDALKIYKADGAPTPQGVTYFLTVDPVASTTSYSPISILFDPLGADGMPLWTREEADALYKRINAASAGISTSGLQKIQ